MVRNDEGQARGRKAVRDAMVARGWNPVDLHRAAGVDPGTVLDFLHGKRWPKLKTQGYIEAALGWEPGTISAVVDGAPPPSTDKLADERAELRERIEAARSLTEQERRVMLAVLGNHEAASETGKAGTAQ